MNFGARTRPAGRRARPGAPPFFLADVSRDVPEAAREGACAPQTADFSPAICSIVRPLRPDTDSRFFGIALGLPPVLTTNHFALPASASTRFSVHSPFNFLPERKTVSAPFQ